MGIVMWGAVEILSINFFKFAHSQNQKYDIISDNVTPEKKDEATIMTSKNKLRLNAEDVECQGNILCKVVFASTNFMIVHGGSLRSQSASAINPRA